jgi:HD superfamily phosphohydrolase
MTSTSFCRQTYKTFNDAVHGHIQLHTLAVKIIDTLEYQRLRDLKQLGGAYTVYPSASHNRFEHSLGVAYLAGKFVRHLAREQPELGITQADILCLEIAGLVHDLGHGILSHLFDMKFIPAVEKGCKWEHEHASAEMLDHLIDKNNLMPHVLAAGLSREVDIHFVKELIYGAPRGAPENWQWKGRGEKTFLYEIVCNKRNGIDVDKWDYFARDCRQLNMAIPFDSDRLMSFARVCKLPGEREQLQICYPVKEAWHVYQMFQARYSLHKRAYQHKVSRVIESMYMEALVAANDFVIVHGKEGKSLKMSQTIYDMEAYSKLSDYLLRTIACSTHPNLEKARSIILRIMRRDIYSFVGEHLLPAFDSYDASSSSEASFNSSASGITAIINGAPIVDPQMLIGWDGFPNRPTSPMDAVSPILLSQTQAEKEPKVPHMNPPPPSLPPPPPSLAPLVNQQPAKTSSSSSVAGPPPMLQAKGGKLVFGTAKPASSKRSSGSEAAGGGSKRAKTQETASEAIDEAIPLSQIILRPVAHDEIETGETGDVEIVSQQHAASSSSADVVRRQIAASLPPLPPQQLRSSCSVTPSRGAGSSSTSLAAMRPRKAWKEDSRLKITSDIVKIGEMLTSEELIAAWANWGFLGTDVQAEAIAAGEAKAWASSFANDLGMPSSQSREEADTEQKKMEILNLTNDDRSMLTLFPNDSLLVNESLKGPLQGISCPMSLKMTEDDILVDIVTINYGQGNKDPVSKVLFYEVDKRNGKLIPRHVRPNDVSVFLPTAFEEQFVRLYVKRKEVRHIATAAFQKWSEGSFPTNKSILYSPARAVLKPRIEGGGGGVGGGGGGGRSGVADEKTKLLLLRNSSLSSL